MFSLENRTALVTGASRGLGAGIAKCLAEAGADVVINYLHSKERAMTVVEEIQKMGRKALAVKADVSKEKDVRQLFDTVLAEFNTLDIFVNNAGIISKEDIFNTSIEKWNELIATNLTSTFLCTKNAMEIMRKQNYGRIIIDASLTGQRGAEYGQVHYAASKGGQIALVKTLARAATSFNTTVNAVAPGSIDSEMLDGFVTPERKKELAAKMPMGFGRIKDVGTAVVFLASDEAGYITGTTLDINGGMNMR